MGWIRAAISRTKYVLVCGLGRGALGYGPCDGWHLGRVRDAVVLRTKFVLICGPCCCLARVARGSALLHCSVALARAAPVKVSAFEAIAMQSAVCVGTGVREAMPGVWSFCWSAGFIKAGVCEARPVMPSARASVCEVGPEMWSCGQSCLLSAPSGLVCLRSSALGTGHPFFVFRVSPWPDPGLFRLLSLPCSTVSTLLCNGSGEVEGPL